MSATSPPSSPLPKRQKPNPTPIADSTPSIASTMASTAPAVTKVDATPPLLIKKLSEKAKLPTRGSAFAAGYDIYAAKDTVVPARGKVLVDTDISMAVPDGTYGRIAPRSGLASKHMIDTGAGVIDADYRGQVKVLLFNHGEKDFEVKEGDRVAQLVLERIYTPEVMEVKELEESVRGAGGFGSTG
ncbi:deoxyuridine 5'-triphosphate nucleotidohydrolase [Hyaloscypha sp. PMI_1271]|nr:deoxyuridine 5'-triphosphate nucleotidohydrolase [Hyaloscypha sp. PMI_1271]